MQFNINRPPKNVRKAAKKEAKRRALEEWHSKFAWLPKAVDETTENYRKVWLERYMRQQRIGPTRASTFDDGRYFVQYSRKEYFRKKLNGDFDKEEFEADTDTGHGNVGGISIGTLRKSDKILKKGGPMSAFKNRQLL